MGNLNLVILASFSFWLCFEYIYFWRFKVLLDFKLCRLESFIRKEVLSEGFRRADCLP